MSNEAQIHLGAPCVFTSLGLSHLWEEGECDDKNNVKSLENAQKYIIDTNFKHCLIEGC